MTRKQNKRGAPARARAGAPLSLTCAPFFDAILDHRGAIKLDRSPRERERARRGLNEVEVIVALVEGVLERLRSRAIGVAAQDEQRVSRPKQRVRLGHYRVNGRE